MAIVLKMETTLNEKLSDSSLEEQEFLEKEFGKLFQTTLRLELELEAVLQER